MQDGFLRAAAASIPVAVADPRRNAAAVCARIDQAHRARAALLVLPELCVTGYTCGDLFLSALLLDAAEEALLNICAHTQNCDPVVVLGVPLRAGGKLYNCAAVLHRGRILGVVPKTWLPNYDVFAEKRCFASAAAYHGPGSVPVSGADVPFGTGLVFACAQMPAFRLGVELCEDVWAPIPPSVRLCLAGATVIANCSASPEAAGKPARRRTLLRAASARGLCGYVYANAGPDESSARAVFSAHHLIAENGDILAEHAPFAPEPGLLVTELDLLTLSAERRRNTTFVPEGAGARAVPFSMPLRPTPLSRAVSPHPFVPDDAALRRKRAELLLSIQAHGLRKRLLHTGSRVALLPVTDDLDSVLALLVCARTMDLLGRARHDVLAVTKRPTPTKTVVPSSSPNTRGSLNKSSASSSVIVSKECSLFSWANLGFSSSSEEPICTTGPKRPIFTETGLPLFGSVPNIRSPTLCSVFVANVVSTSGWKFS